MMWTHGKNRELGCWWTSKLKTVMLMKRTGFKQGKSIGRQNKDVDERYLQLFRLRKTLFSERWNSNSVPIKQ